MTGQREVTHAGVTYRAAFNEHGWCWVEVASWQGGVMRVTHGHPCRDGLGDGRIRVNAVVWDETGGGFLIEVTDNAGRVDPRRGANLPGSSMRPGSRRAGG
jgi:hypothetical protein